MRCARGRKAEPIVDTSLTPRAAHPSKPTERVPERVHARAAIAAWSVLGVCSVVVVLALVHVGRGTTWFFDEWDWVFQRRTGGVDDFLSNHNGHLNAVPVLVYKAWWSAFGLRSYAGFRLLEALLHVAVCGALFVYLRQRVQWTLALASTVVVLTLGYAWQDLLWPFQMQYLGSMAAGLAALLLIDRRSRRGDIGAACALGISLACSGLGLPFVAAIAVRLVLRRRTWSRIWVVVAPMGLYGVWYLGYGQSQVKGANAHLVPGYVARAGAASAGALFGTGLDAVAWTIAGVAVVATIATILVRRSVTPELVGVIVLPLSFWILTAFSRAELHEPAASRYLYPGAIFIVLVGSELVDDPSWPRTNRSRWIGAAIAVVLGAVAIAGNAHELRRGGEGLRNVSTYVKAELAAVELARSEVADDYRPDVARAPQISAGPYLATVRDLGSPADSPAEGRDTPGARTGRGRSGSRRRDAARG